MFSAKHVIAVCKGSCCLPHFNTEAIGACCSAGQCERSLRCGVSVPNTARHPSREGEEARCFLVECAERFLRRNALEGYEAHTRDALATVRRDVEAGRPDMPACDIVAAEIKRVCGMPMLFTARCGDVLLAVLSELLCQHS